MKLISYNLYTETSSLILEWSTSKNSAPAALSSYPWDSSQILISGYSFISTVSLNFNKIMKE